jgi:hypothetical protein
MRQRGLDERDGACWRLGTGMLWTLRGLCFRPEAGTAVSGTWLLTGPVG